MVVKLRLARHGQRNTPYYHIVAINSRKRRDARPLEKLGEYDPIPRIAGTSPWLPPASGTAHYDASAGAPVVKEKRIEWDVARIRYWLGVGAQPTNTVVKLLERGGVLTGHHKWKLHPTKSALNPPQRAAEGGAADASASETAASEDTEDAAQAIASSAEAGSASGTASV